MNRMGGVPLDDNEAECYPARWCCSAAFALAALFREGDDRGSPAPVAPPLIPDNERCRAKRLVKEIVTLILATLCNNAKHFRATGRT
jgi:hypothetical protein